MSAPQLTLFAAALAALTASCSDEARVTERPLREGERCERDAQCETSLCAPLPGEAKTCRRTCAGGCREAEVCTSFEPAADGTGRAGCVPERPGLCQTCELDEHCPYAADACLSLGGLGVCGRDCSADGACPAGYACADGLHRAGGAAPRQCIPKSGTCACTPASAGQRRPCLNENEFGRCSGEEACDGSGWSGCSARVPGAELCNGVDDDCDGATDDAIAERSCGTGACRRTVAGCEGGSVPECTAGAPGAEACNGVDDDCDGATDEDFEVTTVERCGSCTVRCAVAHGTPKCAAGACAVDSCEAGWGDCDRLYANGCEIELGLDAKNCGGCGAACTLDFATAACAAGKCVVGSCLPGHLDVDGDPKNGCEYACVPTGGGVEACDRIDNDCDGATDEGFDTSADPAHCGACGNSCPWRPNATPRCTGGECGNLCAADRQDCDGDRVNGCESDRRTDPKNCGGCGQACSAPAHAMAVCTNGGCGYACESGFQDCDGDRTNGCESVRDADPKNCGGCGTVCPTPAHATATCAGGTCGYACAPPWKDCDGGAGNGCEVDVAGDVNHCSGCAVACPERPNAARTCGAGICGISCAAGWQNCDGDLVNGCESNRATDALHCGSCQKPCPDAANADPVCAASACGLACTSGWANCDTNAGNGCEKKLDTLGTAPNCSLTPVDLGTIDGDRELQTLNAAGLAEGTYKFRVNDSATLADYLSAYIELDSPPGATFALYLGNNKGSGAASCGLNPTTFEPSGPGASAEVDVCACDRFALGDDFDIYLEVVYRGGVTCQDWKIRIVGNTVAPACEAPGSAGGCK